MKIKVVLYISCLSAFLLLFAACDLLNGNDNTFEAGPILFISNKSGTNQLYSMNEDGGEVEQLTHDSHFPIYEAKWSPDGEKIAVISDVGDKQTYPGFRRAIFVMNADGRNRRRLTSQWITVNDTTNGKLEYGGASNMVWSADSKQMVYSRLMVPEALGNLDIFLINTDGTKEKRITETFNLNERITDWSNSKDLLVGDVGDYSATDSSGRAIQYTRLTFFDVEGKILKDWGKAGESLEWPIFSQSGNKITYIHVSKNYVFDVYKINLDGYSQINLTNGMCKYPRSVAWSPNDFQILVYCYEENKAGHRIFALNADGTDSKNITPFENAYISAESWRR